MLFNGKKYDGPREAICVIPRDGEDLVFKAQTVASFDDFDKVCPQPTPPIVVRPGGLKSQDVTDPVYTKALTKWAEYKTCWIILKSLEATKELTWEKVDMSNPETWPEYATELKESGFSDLEVSRLIQIAIEANGLDQEKIDQATQRFLATRQEQ